jgi:hypothetical protein
MLLSICVAGYEVKTIIFFNRIILWLFLPTGKSFYRCLGQQESL